MIDTIHIIGMPSEDTMKRLIQGGLELQFYPAQFAELAAENVGDRPPLLLGLDPVPPAMLSWADVVPEQAELAAGGAIPSTDAIMRAVVQYNRRQLLAQGSAAAAAAPPEAAPAAVAATNDNEQQQQQQPPPLVVGYVMKPSREDALAKSGMLHLLFKEGLCFMPVDLHSIPQQQQEHNQQPQQLQDKQQQQQQQHIDILLHKGSDELLPLEPSSSAGSAAEESAGAACPAAAVGVCWSPRLLALQGWLSQHPSVCVVDPFEHTAKVLDRLLLARLLQQLQGLQLPGGVRARGPGFYEATAFDAALADAVEAAGLRPPFIVKPRVACGVAHSHSMALVLRTGGLQQLQGQVPLPALVQEFVNHGGQQYKVYVMGEQLFVTPRKSIPDVHLDDVSWQQQAPQQQYLLFDSLASLPTQLPAHVAPAPPQQSHSDSTATPTADLQSAVQPASTAPSTDAVKAIAAFLRQQLGLTLFGFDVVVAQHSSSSLQQEAPQQGQQPGQQQGELVVIDVNYFPNYRGGTDVPAMFRAALRQAWVQHQQQLGEQQ